MKFNELTVQKSKNSRRLGRGIAAGQGKTAGRGTKGQNSRSGGRVRPGFEGGQNPLMQRLPKLRGFTSKRPKAETVATGDLDKLGANIDNKALAEAGLITSEYVRAKLVLGGDVAKKHSLKLQGASQSAIKAIEKAGGDFKAVEIPKRPKTKLAEND
jgi:large subunit ribosomal protein L15